MKKDVLLHFLTWAALTSLGYLILLYATLYGWIDSSTGLFAGNRVMFVPMLPGLLMLATETVLHTVALHQQQQQAERSGQTHIAGFWRVGLLSVAVLLLCSGFDSLYFELVDKSIPQAYAESVAHIYATNNQVADDQLVQMFATLPFFLQNIFMNGVCIVLGNLAALLLSRSLKRAPQLAL